MRGSASIRGGFLYMKNKQIIILIGVVFLAFVGYKLIAANIQENKEKAVLQERARLEELAKEPLNKCLEDVDRVTEAKIAADYQTYHNMFKPEFQTECQKRNTKEYCQPPSVEEFNTEMQSYRNMRNVDRNECYKRYK
jgi:hypothetical protein